MCAIVSSSIWPVWAADLSRCHQPSLAALLIGRSCGHALRLLQQYPRNRLCVLSEQAQSQEVVEKHRGLATLSAALTGITAFSPQRR